MTNLKKTVDEMEKIIDVVGILNGEIVQIDYYLVFSSNQDNQDPVRESISIWCLNICQ